MDIYLTFSAEYARDLNSASNSAKRSREQQSNFNVKILKRSPLVAFSSFRYGTKTQREEKKKRPKGSRATSLSCHAGGWCAKHRSREHSEPLFYIARLIWRRVCLPACPPFCVSIFPTHDDTRYRLQTTLRDAESTSLAAAACWPLARQEALLCVFLLTFDMLELVKVIL